MYLFLGTQSRPKVGLTPYPYWVHTKEMDLATYLSTTKGSVESFSQRLDGTSPRTIKKWVSGERTPRPEQQQRISEVTGGAVTPTDFIRVRLDWEARQRAKAAA